MPRFLLIYGSYLGYFSPSEKELLCKSLYIALLKCESTMLADPGGFVSKPVAFLMFMFLVTYLCRRLRL